MSMPLSQLLLNSHSPVVLSALLDAEHRPVDGTVLEGKLPKSQMKLVDAWMEIHKDDLAANWTLLSNGEQFFRIDPLK